MGKYYLHNREYLIILSFKLNGLNIKKCVRNLQT
jgi:hypothetical protein